MPHSVNHSRSTNKLAALFPRKWKPRTKKRDGARAPSLFHFLLFQVLPLEAYHICSQHLLTRDLRRVFNGERLLGIDRLYLGRIGRQRLSDADAMGVLRREAPAERTVAELLPAGDQLRRSQPSPRKKHPALSFSAGQEPSIPTPVKRISRKSVLKVTVFPSRS